MADPVPLDPGDYAGTYKAIGGEISLNFANLVSFRSGARPHDWLSPTENLTCWAILVAGEPNMEGWQPTAQTIDRAVRLRENLAAIFASVADGNAPNESVLTALAAAAGDAWSHRELTSEGPHVHWTFRHDHPPGCQLLDLVALDAVHVLTTADLTQLRACPGCGWVFLDTSATRRRRWCDPADCGNRARQRRHYQRNRRDDLPPAE